MENCIISRDVVIEILARLPVRSLMRFKCVCKIFYSLIKSENHFKHKHFEISRAKRDYVVFLHRMPTYYEDRGFGLLYKESDSDEIGCVDLTFPISNISDLRYADGMFCLVKNYDVFDILLWNPSTREIKKLQNIKALDGFDLSYKTIGFGFSSNMMGKVVMICTTLVMVCSQDGNNSCGWKRFSHSLDISNVDNEGGNLYLKGKYYWSCEINGQKNLLWFDFDDETLGKIELPEIHSPLQWPSFVLAPPIVSAMKDTIALISYCNNWNQIEIWTMNEHNNIISWNKYASVQGNEYSCPMRIWNLGAHLLVYDRHGPVIDVDRDYFSSYDLITQEKKIICNASWDGCLHPLFVYSESLQSF